MPTKLSSRQYPHMSKQPPQRFALTSGWPRLGNYAIMFHNRTGLVVNKKINLSDVLPLAKVDCRCPQALSSPRRGQRWLEHRARDHQLQLWPG